MRFRNIQVSGIEKVVFTHQGTVWVRKQGFINEPYWMKENGQAMTHQKMVRIVHHFENRDDAHVWVHGDTINIRVPR